MRQLRDIKVMLLAVLVFGFLSLWALAAAEDLVFGLDFQRAGWTLVSFRGMQRFVRRRLRPFQSRLLALKRSS